VSKRAVHKQFHNLPSIETECSIARTGAPRVRRGHSVVVSLLVAAASGQTCTGTVASDKCVLTFTAPESTTITAAYEGNADTGPSTSAPYSLTAQ